MPCSGLSHAEGDLGTRAPPTECDRANETPRSSCRRATEATPEATPVAVHDLAEFLLTLVVPAEWQREIVSSSAEVSMSVGVSWDVSTSIGVVTAGGFELYSMDASS